MSGETLGGARQIAARAQALIDLHRFDEALRVAGIGLATSPNDLRLNCLATLALHRLGRNDEALAAAGHAIAAGPTNDWPHRLRASVLLALARGQRRRARRRTFADAAAAAEEAVRCAPREYRGYMLVAEAKSRCGDIDSADAAARRAIELSPDTADTWVARSQVAIAARDHDAARRAAEHALALDPENFAARNNLGVALLHMRRHQEAAEHFVDAGRLRPTSEVVQRNVVAAGTLAPRLVLLFALLPVLLIPAVGVVLYLGIVVAANLALNKSTKFRSWGMRRGVRIARRARRTRSPREIPPARLDVAALRPLRSPRRDRRVTILVAFYLLLWFVWVLTLAGLAAAAGTDPPHLEPGGVIFFVAVSAALAALTVKLVRGRRRASAP